MSDRPPSPADEIPPDPPYSDDSPEDHLVSDYVLFQYFLSPHAGPSPWRQLPELLWEYIDRVDPHIIAAIDRHALYRAAPLFAKLFVALLLETGDDGHWRLPPSRNAPPSPVGERRLVFRDEEKFRERVAKKGSPRPTVPPAMSAVVERMLRDPDSSLFERDSGLTHLIATGSIRLNEWSLCNLFTVDKSTDFMPGQPFQRIIGDARMFNALLQNPVHMELFTLISLMDRFAHCLQSARERAPGVSSVACLTCDLRHWFHQLPLPRHFRRYFRILLGSADGGVVYPRAWPMGAHCVPGIAQACTWSMLLADLEHDANARQALAIDWDGRFDTYLRWLPLKDGGGVFVLIDNIFLFSSDSRVVDRWRARILRMSNRFRITLKHEADYVGVEQPGSAFRANSDAAFTRVDVVRHSPATTITFSGVIFSGVGTRPSSLPCPDALRPDGTWRGSHRALASIVAQCMWSFRVRRVPLLLKEGFMSLHSIVQPPAGKRWDDLVPELGPEATGFLREAYVECCAGHVGPHPVREPSPAPTNTVFVATDASLTPGVISGTGFVYATAARPREPTVIASDHEYDSIVIAELSVVIDAIVEVDAQRLRDGLSPADMFVVAIDSLGAKGMIERCYSRNPAARHLLRRLFDVLKGRWIFLQWVASELNPADAPSRKTPFLAHLWNSLVPSLMGLARYAMSLVIRADVNSLPERRPR